MADVREMYGSTYGASWYTTAAVNAASTPNPKRRPSQSAPAPAANSRLPIHRRWTIQSGTPAASPRENQGPCGHR